jgi:uncharacterized protein (DUF924 family)
MYAYSTFAHMKLVSRTFRTSMAITTDPADLPTSDAILDYWFGAPDEPEHGKVRPLWFTKSEHTDATIRKLFEPAVEAALVGGFAEWTAQPRSRLALVLLLDQFTRNIYRDTSRAFAGDPRALHLAKSAVAAGQDMALTPLERWFLYMPFEHSEVLADPRESVRLFTRLAQETGDKGPLEWAQKHFDVVERFGRFPHRNAILGRPTTVDERKFLEQPGSRF